MRKHSTAPNSQTYARGPNVFSEEYPTHHAETRRKLATHQRCCGPSCRGVGQVNGLPYYKAYPRDFVEGTIGMPFELKGAYRLVLDLIYMQGGELPDDPRYISGLLGCSIRKWKSLRGKLVHLGKIDVSGEFLTNKRAVKELETLAKLQLTKSENASVPRKNNTLEKRQPSDTEPEPDKVPPKSPKGQEVVFSDFWAVWPHKVGKASAEKAWAKIPAQDRQMVVDLTPAWCVN